MNRYVHADCCERSFDNPLLYESGWKKKLNYVIAFSRHSVVDVTARYTIRFDEVLSRRINASEAVVSKQIHILNEQMEIFHRNLLMRESNIGGLSSGRNCSFRFDSGGGSFGVPMDELRERRRCTVRDLDRLLFSTTASKPEETIGRISGDEAWKKARGEDGSL